MIQQKGQTLNQGETFIKSVTPLEALEAANGESKERPGAPSGVAKRNSGAIIQKTRSSRHINSLSHM